MIFLSNFLGWMGVFGAIATCIGLGLTFVEFTKSSSENPYPPDFVQWTFVLAVATASCFGGAVALS